MEVKRIVTVRPNVLLECSELCTWYSEQLKALIGTTDYRANEARFELGMRQHYIGFELDEYPKVELIHAAATKGHPPSIAIYCILTKENRERANELLLECAKRGHASSQLICALECNCGGETMTLLESAAKQGHPHAKLLLQKLQNPTLSIDQWWSFAYMHHPDALLHLIKLYHSSNESDVFLCLLCETLEKTAPQWSLKARFCYPTLHNGMSREHKLIAKEVFQPSIAVCIDTKRLVDEWNKQRTESERKFIATLTRAFPIQ